MPRRLRNPMGAGAVVAALVGVLAFASSAAATAHERAAASEEAGETTWSVRPADEGGADGRAWIELELDPGESTQEHMEVRNLGDSDAVFVLQAADGYVTSTGRFNMLPSSQESTEAGTWVELPESVEVKAGAAEIVPITVTAPGEAPPGDHLAGVAATVLSKGTDGAGNTVGVESRVGFRLLTRVTGQYEPAVEVETSPSFSAPWNPLHPGAVDVPYTIRNTGNTRLRVTSSVRVAAVLGADAVREGEEMLDLAPGEVRTGHVRFAGMWPLGAYAAVVTAHAATSPETASGGEVEGEARASAAAVPWSQLAAAAAVALASLLVVDASRRRRRRLEGLLAAAREEGRRSASE